MLCARRHVSGPLPLLAESPVREFAVGAESRSSKVVLNFAGPNGSGKSSVNSVYLTSAQLGFSGEYVNADDIARTLIGKIPDDRTRNIIAAQEAEARRLACLASGKSFAFETVMSTPEKVALRSQARALGYGVDLVFVTTSDPEINVARVANRVALGGHDVATESIKSRY